MLFNHASEDVLVGQVRRVDEGVAQYGLYPDWIEDLAKVAGADGAAITDDMSRGPEAYLQMWERAEGIQPDSCRSRTAVGPPPHFCVPSGFSVAVG